MLEIATDGTVVEHKACWCCRSWSGECGCCRELCENCHWYVVNEPGDDPPTCCCICLGHILRGDVPALLRQPLYGGSS